MKKIKIIVMIPILALGIKSYFIGKDSANRERRFLMDQEE